MAPYTVGRSPSQSTVTVQAIAYKSGCFDSGIALASFVITEPVCAAPVTSLGAGAYYAGRQIALACATPGASIRYTTNGSSRRATIVRCTRAR